MSTRVDQVEDTFEVRMKISNSNIKNIRPFVKWAGGKASLVDELEKYLPADFDQHDITYIEPFVGGGGMLFYMLTHHKNIQKALKEPMDAYAKEINKTNKSKFTFE